MNIEDFPLPAPLTCARSCRLNGVGGAAGGKKGKGALLEESAVAAPIPEKSRVEFVDTSRLADPNEALPHQPAPVTPIAAS